MPVAAALVLPSELIHVAPIIAYAPVWVGQATHGHNKVFARGVKYALTPEPVCIIVSPMVRDIVLIKVEGVVDQILHRRLLEQVITA